MAWRLIAHVPDIKAGAVLQGAAGPHSGAPAINYPGLTPLQGQVLLLVIGQDALLYGHPIPAGDGLVVDVEGYLSPSHDRFERGRKVGGPSSLYILATMVEYLGR